MVIKNEIEKCIRALDGIRDGEQSVLVTESKLAALELYKDVAGFRNIEVKKGLELEIHGNQYLIKAEGSLSPMIVKTDDLKDMTWDKYTIVGYGEMTRFFNIGDEVTLWTHPVVTDLDYNIIQSKYVKMPSNKINIQAVTKQIQSTLKLLVTNKEFSDLKPHKIVEYVVVSEHEIVGKIC